MAAPYVLVVESDPELQRRIGETLREARYELAAETDGAWAKRSLLVRTPDVLVVDTSLADGTGFQVADELRKDPESADVPIFFIASRFRGSAHEVEAKRRFDPAEYLEVPLDLNTLLARVLEAVPPTRPRPTTASTPVAAPASDLAQRQERRKVEQEAQKLAAGESELSGSLGRLPFARVLQRIYARRLSGALLLVRGDVKKIVYFQDGYPVSVRSNVLAECLGQHLVARRMISREALDESVRRMKEEKRQQGAILVEMGLLSPYRLATTLREQMEAKLLEIFAWREGHFTFKENQPVPGEPVSLERTTAGLILEGIRRHYDEARLEAVLAGYAGQVVTPSRDPLRRLQDITVEPNERAFVDSIVESPEGTKKLEALLADPGVPRDKARLLLVAMAESGMIEPAGRAKTGTSRVPADVRRRPPAATEGSLPPPRARSELAALYDAKRAETHFEALGVGPNARERDVDAAYERLARDFHPDRYRGRSEASRELAQKIFDRLTEARTVLMDPARRTSYVARLEKLRAMGEGAREGGAAAAEPIYWTGVEHLRARRYPEAVAAFRRAVNLAPGQAGYHGALGWALYRQAPADPRAVDAGLAELRRAVSLDERDPWIRVSLGRFHAETGRADLAVRELEAALALNPGLPEIGEEIRRLRATS